MEKLRLILDKYSTRKIVLTLFIITQATYFIMLLVTIPGVMGHAGGMKIFDMLPTGYNPEYALQLLEALGEKGRSYYLLRQIPLDMIYPGLFATSYSLLLYYLYKKSFKQNRSIIAISIIPVFCGLFDYLENFFIIVMLKMYPAFSTTIANSANYFSLLKSSFTIIFFIILVFGLIIFITKKIQKKLKVSAI